MGFKAIQGTSGGIAAALGYPDGEVMSRDLFVEITGNFAAAVSVPVNADGERGYGDENEIKETVRRLIAAGVAGMNLEDGAGGKPGGARGLVELSEQLRKIKAVMETKRALGSEFFLNARVDAFHVITDPKKALDEAIQRGNAYAEAGGDCIFYLFVHSGDIIGRLAKEVKAPISILAGPQAPSVSELQDLGVARVSYGSAFLKAAIGGTRKLAQEILEKGRLQLSKRECRRLRLRPDRKKKGRVTNGGTRYGHFYPYCAYWRRADEVGYKCKSGGRQRTGGRSLLHQARYLFQSSRIRPRRDSNRN